MRILRCKTVIGLVSSPALIAGVLAIIRHGSWKGKFARILGGR